MKRLGSIVLVCVALACALAFGAERTGTPLPFGITLPTFALQSSGGGTTQVSIGTVYFEGAGTDTTVVSGNGGSVRLSAGYGVQFSDSAKAMPAVSLERRVLGGRWTRTSSIVAVPQGHAMTVVTPAYSASGATATVQYRLAAPGSVSRTMTVVYENQHRYAGVAATIYRDLAAFCPNTAVHVAELHGREAGDYRTGALLILVDRTVGRTTVTSAIDQRALAIHECSHERQWLDYGADAAGRTAMESAAKRYFTMPGTGVDPVEHAADCGAQSENPGGYMGYGGTCTALELHEGKRLLHGLRY